MKNISIDEMAMFCKRKGFVFPSGEIYGGLAGFWDFGPIGAELKKNLKEAWWSYHIYSREDTVGIDGAIISHPSVWKASGHVDSFVDLAVVCKKCKNKSKVDKHELEKSRCEKCGGSWESKGEFNPMFITQIGPIKEDSVLAYLRPETAQLIFADFKQIIDTNRLKLPFGIGQMGRSFRNEIAPRNFLFRCREFEQMEIEYFIDPEKKGECPYEIPDLEVAIYSAEMQERGQEAKCMKIAEALRKKLIMLPWHAYWLATELSWFKSLGANLANFRIRQHQKDERSHYATDTWDIEYNFPFGFKELQGIADRGNFDLTQHQKASSRVMEWRDEETGRKFLPMVISEPSLGVERAFLVFLFDAYTTNSKGEIVLRLHPRLSPVKAAIFPLIKKDEKQVEIARKIYLELKKEWNVDYDDGGSVGRRYARNDEIGTPFCITVDSESMEKSEVTIRDRNTTKQIRVKVSEVKETLRELISGEIEFERAGKLI
jgi:glycyl-tRNA synthetase